MPTKTQTIRTVQRIVPASMAEWMGQLIEAIRPGLSFVHQQLKYSGWTKDDAYHQIYPDILVNQGIPCDAEITHVAAFLDTAPGTDKVLSVAFDLTGTSTPEDVATISNTNTSVFATVNKVFVKKGGTGIRLYLKETAGGAGAGFAIVIGYKPLPPVAK